MKKTILSLSILAALLFTLFQPVYVPGEGDVSTCDLIEQDYQL